MINPQQHLLHHLLCWTLFVSELLKLRNTLVHHIHNCVTKEAKRSRLTRLPDILTDRQTCQYCPQQRNCALYERYAFFVIILTTSCLIAPVSSFSTSSCIVFHLSLCIFNCASELKLSSLYLQVSWRQLCRRQWGRCAWLPPAGDGSPDPTSSKLFLPLAAALLPWGWHHGGQEQQKACVAWEAWGEVKRHVNTSITINTCHKTILYYT